MKPSGAAGKLDIHFTINSNTVYVLPGLQVYDSSTGFAMSFYATTAAYNTLEYEEIEAFT